jgi:hypothetical protein
MFNFALGVLCELFQNRETNLQSRADMIELGMPQLATILIYNLANISSEDVFFTCLKCATLVSLSTMRVEIFGSWAPGISLF